MPEVCIENKSPAVTETAQFNLLTTVAEDIDEDGDIEISEFITARSGFDERKLGEISPKSDNPDARRSFFSRNKPPNKCESLPVMKQRSASGSGSYGRDRRSPADLENGSVSPGALLRLNQSEGSHLSLLAKRLSIGDGSSKKVEEFYKRQEELKTTFRSDVEYIQLMVQQKLENHDEENLAEPGKITDQDELRQRRRDYIIAVVTFIINASLIFVKAGAAYMSGSFSVISSVVDSVVDVVSSVVIWVTTRAIRKRDPYQYPRGRTRLEPIALIIVSIVMAVASIQMVIKSLEARL